MIKAAIASVVVCLLLAQPVAAQSHEEQIKGARRTISIGLAMMGAGALMAPLTAVNESSAKGPLMTAGVGLIVIGGGVVWWGATRHRNATHPQTTIGINLGRSKALQLRHTW